MSKEKFNKIFYNREVVFMLFLQSISTVFIGIGTVGTFSKYGLDPKWVGSIIAMLTIAQFSVMMTFIISPSKKWTIIALVTVTICALVNLIF